jgi:hypothetical protein
LGRQPIDQRLGDRITPAFKKLAETFAGDIEKGFGLSKSGWTNPSILGLDMAYIRNLIDTGILAENENGSVRLNPKSKVMISRALRREEVLQNQVKYSFENADALRLDFARMSKATHLLSEVSESLKRDENHWREIVIVGWWRMLVSSGMPAPLEAVIRAGFSPRDWTVKATWASFQLASTVADKSRGPPTFEDSVKYISVLLESTDLAIEEPILAEPSELVRIREAVSWDEILNSLPLETKKALGLAWFCYFLWEIADCVPFSETNSNVLSSMLLASVCELANSTVTEIASSLDSLADGGLAWTREIINLPEVTW